MSDSKFPIIGIGASAGGIDAFHTFFNHMPADCGMAFVVILHLPPDRKSMLSDILSRWTSMPVIDATLGTRIEANHVYVPPPHAIVTLLDGRLEIELPTQKSDRVFRPIDGFFDSLGTAMREQAVGIVLSAPVVMVHWDSRPSRNAAGSQLRRESMGPPRNMGKCPQVPSPQGQSIS